MKRGGNQPPPSRSEIKTKSKRDIRVFEQEQVDPPADGSSKDRSNPEEPELLQGPPVSGKDSRAGATRRIYRGIRYGNADQVNQREGQADCDWSEACWN